MKKKKRLAALIAVFGLLIGIFLLILILIDFRPLQDPADASSEFAWGNIMEGIVETQTDTEEKEDPTQETGQDDESSQEQAIADKELQKTEMASANAGLGYLIDEYQDYEDRFASIEEQAEIAENGYQIIEEQIFPVVFETFGEEELIFIPAMEEKYHRLAIFLVDKSGHVLWKTNQLETNYYFPGELEQPTQGIAAVSFQDVNKDALTDILLITTCENESGNYAGIQYKLGDVLYQEKQGFYRDWRVSDQLNRFGMNKSIHYITAYARDGYSSEFLYTATTLKELMDNGFEVFEQQNYFRNFEKLGRLQIVPGVFSIAEYDIFMIYLVNEEGYIVWSFQPMEDYDSLFSMMGMKCEDLDGDGMKDLAILARFSYEGPNGELNVDTRCLIYYQRTGGFATETEFQKLYQFTEKDKLTDIVVKIRAFWGWKAEND